MHIKFLNDRFLVETKIPCNILDCQWFVNNSYKKADVANNVEGDEQDISRTVKIRFLRSLAEITDYQS